MTQEAKEENMSNELPTADDLGIPLTEVRDHLMIALTAAGYDLSGTDHDDENYIEVGATDHEFRIRIEAL